MRARQAGFFIRKNNGQMALAVILLLLVLGLIAAFAIGIVSGKVVINPQQQAVAPAVTDEDLLQKEKELKEREKRLKELEERIKVQQEDINRQKQKILQEMQGLVEKVGQAKIESKNEEKSSPKGDERISYLAKLYSGMKPDAVAKIFKEMDKKEAAQILSKMGNRQAAKVMGALSPGLAAEITRVLKEGVDE